MMVFIWNVRGLGQPSKKAAITTFSSKYSSTILALLETKLPDPNLQLIHRVWGRRPCQWIVLLANGALGGIWVVWDPSDLTLNSHLLGKFSVTLLSNISDGVPWKFIVVYGPNSRTLRHSFWAEQDHVSSLPHPIWCRNFSTSISQEMRDFSDFICRNELLDVPLQGCQYTWSNYSTNPTFSKLYRFLLSVDWEENFLRTLSLALPKPTSDHCPILLDTNAITRGLRPSALNSTGCKKHPFIHLSKPGGVLLHPRCPAKLATSHRPNSNSLNQPSKFGATPPLTISPKSSLLC
ncbi:hypothetical protein AMTRI_Chr10g470 [Amborella trichopoda]